MFSLMVFHKPVEQNDCFTLILDSTVHDAGTSLHHAHECK
jgi:hypothetical protein